VQKKLTLVEYTGEKKSYQIGETVFTKQTPRAYVSQRTLSAVLQDPHLKVVQ